MGGNQQRPKRRGSAVCGTGLRGLLLLGLLLFPLAISWGQTTAPGGAKKFRISGTVVNEENGEIVRDATVRVGKSESTDALQTVNTAEDGGFSFGGLDAGKYWLQAEGRGFTAQAFEAHGGFSTAIVTGRGIDTEHLMFALRAQPWYAQSGAGATVKAVNSGRENGKETETGEMPEGANNRAADPSLDVTYALTFYAGATEESGATPLVLRSGERATADVRLTPVPALHVRVSPPSNDPAEPLAVNVMQKVFDAPETQVQTQNMPVEKGEMELGGIAPGDYEVRVQTFGANPQSWLQHAVIKRDTQLALDQAPSSVQIKGIVKITSGAALRKGGVQLWNRASGEQFGALISEKGEFDFSSQPIVPGTYEVQLAGSDDERVGSIAASGAKVRGQNVEIVGEGAVQLTIQIARGFGRIDGTALRDGKAASGMMVLLVPRDAENNLPLVRRDQSDLDGTFSLRRVVPGSYGLLVLRNGWDKDWRSPETLSGYWKSGKPVEISAGKTMEVRVEAQ